MRAILKFQWAALTTALALAPLFSGAAELPKPGASAAEVRAELGPPTAVRNAAGKNQTWEYAGKPSPYETYFLAFSKDGRLKTIRQVITDETFAQVKSGMTIGQVRALLGTPWRITDWDDDADSDIADMLEYRGHDEGGTYKFHIEFDKRGRVVVAAKVRDIAGNNRRDGELAKSTEARSSKP
jgi:outer membrane protein assembly factor BamE (lipoprotein component of BamABCDE complex)